jgi:hypothetical protein
VFREGEGEEALQRDEDDLEEVGQLRRSQPSLQLHQPMPRDEIKIEDGTPEKPQLSSPRQDESDSEEENENG